VAVRRIAPTNDSLAESLRQLLSYRSLIATLTRREISLRYKQTALGIAWALVHPLTLMVVMSVVFSRVVKVSSEGVPYPLFAYAALLPWTFVSTATSLSTQSLVKDVDLVTRVWFPRQILPMGCVLASLCDFAIALTMFFVLLLIYGQPPSWTVVGILPLVVVQFTLVLGLALFNSAINVRYRDVKFVVPLLVQLWMFVSPVIYSSSLIPDRYIDLYRLNPVVGLIDGYRAALLHHRLPTFEMVAPSAVVALVVFAFGWWYFRRVEIHFADVI